MNKERLMNIILKPWITEKTGQMEVNSTYAFIVAMDARKHEIAQAIKYIFNVDVKAVNTLIMKPTTKQTGRTVGRTKAYKKASISLEPGQIIQLSKLKSETE